MPIGSVFLNKSINTVQNGMIGIPTETGKGSHQHSNENLGHVLMDGQGWNWEIRNNMASVNIS
jgi:hypothetical protein